MNLELLLRAHIERQDSVSISIIKTSLDAMCSGGMYDHIGGGFARYSVDREWLVPHFEKMLYDQALLTRIYLHAHKTVPNPTWKQVVEETIEYVLRDLRHVDGGFFSSEDADSLDQLGHSHEGSFYIWTPEEVESALGVDGEKICDWFQITADGNFEGRSIPTRMANRGQLQRPAELEQLRQRLLATRNQRSRPGLDNKILTEWNAMMLSSLIEAACLLDRDDWMRAAVINAEFLVSNLKQTNGRWFRSWQQNGNPQARHFGLAQDLANLVEAFTRLGEALGQARWINEAKAVADHLLDHYWDTVNGGVFTSPDYGEELIVRQKDLMDNATPSANSTTFAALLRLGALTGEARYTNQARQIAALLGPVAIKAPSAFGNFLSYLPMLNGNIKEVVITGNRRDLVEIALASWDPTRVLAWGEHYDSPLWQDRPDGLAFVCQNYSCSAPASTVGEFRRALSTTNPSE